MTAFLFQFAQMLRHDRDAVTALEYGLIAALIGEIGRASCRERV